MFHQRRFGDVSVSEGNAGTGTQISGQLVCLFLRLPRCQRLSIWNHVHDGFINYM